MTDDNDSMRELARDIARSVGSDGETSRRGFLNRTALAGGSLLALGGLGTGFAMGGGRGSSLPQHMAERFDDVEGTDLDVLEYALTLERLEDAFYQQGTEMFSEDDFANADALQDVSESFRMEVYDQVTVVGEHESSHVDVLGQAIELLGGTLPAECTYDFGIESVGDFLSLGATLENTGVAAYAGAAPFIDSPDLLTVALSIHSVEARHAAMFNVLNETSPFPAAYDDPASQSAVLEAVEPLIAECEDGDDHSGTSTATETEESTETHG